MCKEPAGCWNYSCFLTTLSEGSQAVWPPSEGQEEWREHLFMLCAIATQISSDSEKQSKRENESEISLTEQLDPSSYFSEHYRGHVHPKQSWKGSGT